MRLLATLLWILASSLTTHGQIVKYYDTLADMLASDRSDPNFAAIVHGTSASTWSEWRWVVGDATATNATTIMASTHPNNFVGRWFKKTPDLSVIGTGAVSASNIVSGGQLPIGTLAPTNAATGQVLGFDGTERIWETLGMGLTNVGNTSVSAALSAGTNIVFSTNGTTISINTPASTGGNWTAVGTTNQSSSGTAFVNSLYATNNISADSFNIGTLTITNPLPSLKVSGTGAFNDLDVTNSAKFQNATASKLATFDALKLLTNATSADVQGTLGAVYQATNANLTSLQAYGPTTWQATNATLTSLAASGAASVGGGSISAITPTTSLQWLSPWGCTSLAGTEVNVSQLMPFNATIKNLYVKIVSMSAGSNTICKIYTNGVASSLAVTNTSTGANVTSSDTTDTVPILAGTPISLSVLGNTSEANIGIRWTVQFSQP